MRPKLSEPFFHAGKLYIATISRGSMVFVSFGYFMGVVVAEQRQVFTLLCSTADWLHNLVTNRYCRNLGVSGGICEYIVTY
jgi:hypothetical protein